jgi:hypothetical protein
VSQQNLKSNYIIATRHTIEKAVRGPLPQMPAPSSSNATQAPERLQSQLEHNKKANIE